MKLKDFLKDLLNAPDLTIKVNGKVLSDKVNADSEIIMWEVHHNIIEIWVVENES